MPFEIMVSGSANNQLASFPKSIQDEIKEGLQVLQENPDQRRARADIRKLVNVGDYWRLRIGDYRVFYRIGSNTTQVFVDMIIHKQQADKEIAKLREKTKKKKKHRD